MGNGIYHCCQLLGCPVYQNPTSFPAKGQAAVSVRLLEFIGKIDQREIVIL